MDLAVIQPHHGVVCTDGQGIYVVGREHGGRHGLGLERSRAELSLVVSAPAPDLSIRVECTSVEESSTHAVHLRRERDRPGATLIHSVSDTELTVVVVAPAGEGVVVESRTGVVGSEGQLAHDMGRRAPALSAVACGSRLSTCGS
jgi:hypothetical protein